MLKVSTISFNTIQKRFILTPILVIAALSLLFTAFFAFSSKDVSARPAFNAGNIISDSTMRSQSMSVSQIQAFLESKGVNCDGSMCLKNYKQNNKKASQILYDTGRQYKINPQVLIVLLQKEVGLVTDSSPASWQYRTAAGYGCPDSTPGVCDSSYHGFTNQMKWAATMFDAILRNSPTWYAPYTVGQNNILLHPHNDCGTQRVSIQNRATAALYSYTPYVPNQAALNAGYGTGDSCSSYGNRNFHLYYQDWFGKSAIQDYYYRHEKLLSSAGAVINTSSVKVGNSLETLTIKNKIYTFYHDTQNKTLRYSYYDGSRWSDHLIDGAGSNVRGALNHDVGAHTIMAFERHGQPQVYYRSSTDSSLRHAWIPGNSDEWRVETLDGASKSISGQNENIGIAIEGFTRGHNGIQLYYYNQGNKSLKHAWFDGSKWRFETLDGSSTSVSGSADEIGPQIQGFNFGENGGIQLYYYNQGNKSLKHAWFDGSKWRFETLDGSSTSVLKNNRSVGSAIGAVPYNKDVQLFYYDESNGELRHAWWRAGQGWRQEVMDGNTSSVLKNVIDSGAKISVQEHRKDIFVAYYDNSASFSDGRKSAWRMTQWNGNSWVQRILDGNSKSLTGSDTSVPQSTFTMEPYSNGSLQMFYRLSDGSMRHVWANK